MNTSVTGRNQISVLLLIFIVMIPLIAHAQTEPSAQPVFSEAFSDANLISRGWYDGTSGHKVIVDSDRGSNVLEFNFASTGGQTGVGALRHAFPETERVNVRYYVKYSDNWTWTGQSYGPHEIYLLTNKQSAYSGLAYTNLTCYIEVNNGKPHIVIQDGMNIDASRINQDLAGITENRAIAGGNGCGADGYNHCAAYNSGGKWMNGKGWLTAGALFENNKWYMVEAEFRMNSIIDGRAVADGCVKYWLNNTLVINRENVILRTGQNPNMKFTQVVIAPYYHNGVPHPQKFWLDDFAVGDTFIGGAIPGQDVTPPARPTGVTVTPVE